MSISDGLLRERTFKDRIRLWALTRLIGFHERTAVDWIWPLKDKRGKKQNSNRIEKFRNWKRKDIWPPTEQELQKAEAEGLLDTEELKHLQNRTEQAENRRKRLFKKTAQLLNSMPEDEIERRSLGSPEVARVEKLHVGCRLPRDYVEKLEHLGGRKSTHIKRAIQLYLGVKDLEAGIKPGKP